MPPTRMKTPLADRRGTSVRLGRAIARGGEGTIHEIVGRKGYVAKLYHEPPPPDKAKKLEALVALGTETLLGTAAWPVEVLRDPSKRVVGVVMPHVEGYKDIHLLYGPSSRMREFPLASWPFLIRAATNLARAFAVVHSHGHVIGDVNDKLALVSRDALVKLVDCDSFQLVRGKQTYSCDVGVLTHQPPELQGVTTFRGLTRTQNHDNFGLAVLVFQLLFMARHPFSGSFEGGDLPLERSIKEFRFVYGPGAAKRGMSPPPCSLSLEAVTPEVAGLFERAFSPKSAGGKRPTAKQWTKALQGLATSVRTCRSNPNHAYLSGGACPFCPLEAQAGSALFNQPMIFRTKGGGTKRVAINVGAIWKKICSIEPPPAEEPVAATRLASPTVTPQAPQGSVAGTPATGTSEDDRFLGWAIQAAIVITSLALAAPTGYVSLLGLLLVLAFLPASKRGVAADPDTPRMHEARRALTTVQKRWDENASRKPFDAERQRLRAAKKELDGLDAAHEKRLRELSSKKSDHQLRSYLDRHRIARAKIDAITSAVAVVLESYGIETALHVDEQRLAGVPTLGPAIHRRLITWRKKLERSFHYDPSRGVDPVVVQELDREFRTRRAELVQVLADGPMRLRLMVRRIRRARVALQGDVATALHEFESARWAA